MADYRRAVQPGGTFFFTLVTHHRQTLFSDPANVDRLRKAVLAVMNERPFEFLAGVVLPDHVHYLWTLPPGDSDFSTRIGRMKVLFTKSLHADRERCAEYMVGDAHPTGSPNVSSHVHPAGSRNVGWAPPTTHTRSASRIKHRDADVWQRRFWEHTIRDTDDLNRHLDYIHYNPVKHGLTNCPHSWAASSFERWVDQGSYDRNWCCQCSARMIHPPDFAWAGAGME